MGSNIAQDFDKDGLIETLCEEGEKDEFYRMAHTFDDLCDQVGHSTGRYVSKINRIGEGGDEQEIKNALIPLHEVFSGYVCVDYYSGVADEEGSVLRKSREIDYDETFEVWEHELEYYYDDTIYITYYSDTGKAYIDIGKDVEPEFSGKDISEIETSFRMAENENDFSGFASGITALTEKIANPDEPDRFAVIGIVVIAAVLFAIGVMLIKGTKGRADLYQVYNCLKVCNLVYCYQKIPFSDGSSGKIMI